LETAPFLVYLAVRSALAPPGGNRYRMVKNDVGSKSTTSGERIYFLIEVSISSCRGRCTNILCKRKYNLTLSGVGVKRDDVTKP